MKSGIIIFIIALLFVVPMDETQAQCLMFAKKECIPELEPYIFNGQMNGALLNEGDVAEVIITFYANQEYRVLVCAEDKLGDISFKLKDIEDNILFDNKNHDMRKMWDFSSNTTQQIIVEIEVPESDMESESLESGCVSVLVGFKE